MVGSCRFRVGVVVVSGWDLSFSVGGHMQGTGGGVRPRLEVCQVGLGVSGEHPIPALRGKMQSSGGTHVLAGDSALVGGAKKESGGSTLGVPSGLQFESSAHPD